MRNCLHIDIKILTLEGIGFGNEVNNSHVSNLIQYLTHTKSLIERLVHTYINITFIVIMCSKKNEGRKFHVSTILCFGKV